MNATNRGLWLAIFALGSLVLALIAAGLVLAKTRDWQDAIFTGGATFAGALVLAITAAGFIGAG
ncbi:hypothetical protein GCM10009557_06010 [Virgisporangium ochraceum]|uniref:Uncharacterized protein n=1 Tax=Virgisporangium ochraceum TaxID=65505 RepID=A0A8J3ZNS2_9ACTN|nr:hypothetical protein [Virgisporangium ochraceum]GIJ66258.1 hypothetical protein Voc01_011750 [Virgisporangium ochraceum]